MSKLSELLNPAPTSQTSPPATQSFQPPQVQPLVLDGQDHRTTSFSHGSPTHSRYPSLTSPGLDALADLASNSAPILSPPSNTSTFATSRSASFQPSGYAQYGSRPGSSHTLPPLSDGYTSGQPHSTGLEQYHHLSGGERRPEGAADHSTRLPPVQHTSDPSSCYTADAFDQLHEVSKHANNGMVGQWQATSTQPKEVSSTKDLHQNVDAPSTLQIRQPSPRPSQPLSTKSLLDTQSEQVEIKAELTENILDTSHIEASAKEGSGVVSAQPRTAMVLPASKALADIKNDPTPMLIDNSTDAPLKSKPAPSKKRPAPSSKKGTASTVKPAAKKRKLENENIDGATPGQRTGTPATSRASMTPAPKQRKESVTPAYSSSVADGPEGESEEEDNEVYCICRKPDDHTIMIGCDGPCQDWYHMRCVDMDTAKSKLIHKWYCPLCVEKGHETLWKRMCRLEGCQEPARQDSDPKSKYCSDEHGAEFMRLRIMRGEGEQNKPDAPRSHKKKRDDNYTDNFGNTGDGLSDDDFTQLRGGILQSGQLKALVDGSKDVNSFRRLGEGVLSPPTTASPEGDEAKKKISYTTEEEAQLKEISDKRDKCRAKKKMLDDRDKLLMLVTARGKAVLSELREKDKSIKDVCGYDSRLTWSDQEFNEWRTSSEGQKALEKGGVLGPLPPVSSQTTDTLNNGQAAAGNSVENEDDEEEIGKGVCKKKRCERHRNWLKLQQQENMFEKDQARQEMKRLEAEEKGLINRATIRSLGAREAGEG